MGVLAVGVGKVNEALPFFKTVLEANPNVAQFWLSYIDALVKLNRIDETNAVLDQAKSNGAEGELFAQLEKRRNPSALSLATVVLAQTGSAVNKDRHSDVDFYW